MPKQKTAEDLLAELEAKRADLDAQIEAAKAKQREQRKAENAKCDTLIARVVRKRMAADSAFADGVKALLDADIKAASDRALLKKTGLLPEAGRGAIDEAATPATVAEQRPAYAQG